MNTIVELQDKLEVAKKRLDSLKAQRNELSKQIADLEGGKISKKSKSQKRVKNDVSLSNVIKGLLSDGNPCPIKDIVKAVKNSKYKTKSASLYSCVATVLVKGDFEKVSRGVYQIKAETIMTDNPDVPVMSAVEEPQTV